MSSTQKSSFSSAKRVLATAASAAMIFALLPAGIALGESPDNVCPPPDGVETFPDVDTGVHADNVECAAGYDIVNGYPDGEYKPGLDVFRAQMATFIVNTIEAARGEAMPAGDNAFDDDDSSPHHANINKLAEAGIVQGQGGDYNPARKVNRAAMATFIANAIDYVDDQDPANNSVLPAAATDHFIDDELSPHEENINRLADAGVVEGVSATQYDPEVIVFRGQMASFVIEAASELEEQGLWEANDAAPATTNEDFALTPDDASENTVSTGSTTNANRGARQYTVSGLDDTKTYDIQLYPSENVTDTDGIITFADDNENSTAGDGEADLDTTPAVVEVVNGSDVTDNRNVQTSPVNGTITFTVDSETADSIIPVVFIDTENDGTLELDADNAPTEEFGIGGKKTWIPAEAGSGRIDADAADDEDEDIVSVDKTADRIITDEATYFYDSNDTFYISSTDSGQGTDNTDCGTVAAQVTMTKFEAELSAGDELDEETVYQPESELPSTFCLEDISPAAPSITAVDEQTEDGGEVTLTGVVSGATVTVYCEKDADSNNAETVTTSSTKCAESATDADTTEANFQIVLTGLEASTNYDIAANQTKDGETSALSSESDITTTAVGVAARPTITDAKVTTDTGIVGVIDTGDIWTLTFDQDMDDDLPTTASIVVQDEDGDRYQVNCEGTNPTDDGNDRFLSAECFLEDSGSNVDRILRIRISETTIDADADLSGTSTGDNVAEYPATITNTDDDVEDQQGDVVDLAASTDLVVDKE